MFEFARPGTVIADDAERRIQRQLSESAGRPISSWRTIASSGRARNSRRGRRDVATRFGYAVRFAAVGEVDPALGPPTQMAIFDGRAVWSAHGNQDSRARARRAGRSVRLGQVHVCAQALHADRDSLVATTVAAWSSDDENDQAATKDAFEVLQFIAAKRLAAGRLTVIDATNVATRSAQAARSSWRASITACRSRSCSICRSAICQERNAARAGSRLRRARHSQSDAAAAQVAPRARARRLPPCHVLRSVEEAASADDRARAAVEQQEDASTVRSTSSATSMGVMTKPLELLRDAWLRSRETRVAATRSRTRRDARPCSSATWWTAGRIAWRAPAGDEHGRRWRRLSASPAITT